MPPSWGGVKPSGISMPLGMENPSAPPLGIPPPKPPPLLLFMLPMFAVEISLASIRASLLRWAALVEGMVPSSWPRMLSPRLAPTPSRFILHSSMM